MEIVIRCHSVPRQDDAIMLIQAVTGKVVTSSVIMIDR